MQSNSLNTCEEVRPAELKKVVVDIVDELALFITYSRRD